MELDFRDAVSGMRVPSPDDNTYSIVQLAHEHRERYIFHTHAGDIILRRLPLRLYRLIQSQRLKASVSLQGLIAEFSALADRLKGVPDDMVAEEDRKRLKEMAEQLAVSDYSALGVIEAPQILTMDDYDDLLAKLDEDERDTLQNAVAELSSVRAFEDVDATEQVICDQLGIKTIDPTMYGLMTVSQSAYWSTLIARQNDEMKRQMERYR